jgi:outer membrane immunogenic protein
MKTRIIVGAIAGLLALPGSALAQFIVTVPNDSGRDSDSSWLAGAQLGHNWQRGPWVYGFETDIAWTNLKTSISKGFDLTAALPPGVEPPSAFTTAKIDWYGTLRGRLGWANGPWLFYGTGGLAYGGVKLNSTFDLAQAPQFGFTPLSARTSSVKTGWVLGVGADYLWGPNTIVSLGYQYVDLGKAQIAETSNPAPGITFSQTATAHARFQEVSLGISWKFPPDNMAVASRPVMAADTWEGWYAGGHAGDAWGLRTNADYSSSLVTSDARLKRDIMLVGRRDDGLGIYRYRYLWSDTVYEGVMAQEVALLHPEAIVRSRLDDYLRVDYSRLGMTLKTVSN